MNLTEILSTRIGLSDIRLIVSSVALDESNQDKLFRLLFNTDPDVAFRAVWVMSHILPPANSWLIERQNELIDEVMVGGSYG